jgi:hypothetical protein
MREVQNLQSMRHEHVVDVHDWYVIFTSFMLMGPVAVVVVCLLSQLTLSLQGSLTPTTAAFAS